MQRGTERVGGWGDRSVSVREETPKQVSKRQTDRQTEYIRNGGKGEEQHHWTHREEDKEHRTVRLTGLQLVVSAQTFVLSMILFRGYKADRLLIEQFS